MADRRSDPIEDDTPQKRRKLNTVARSVPQAWDSDEDDAEAFTEDDFQTQPTLPVAPNQQRKLQYGPSQLHSNLGTRSSQSYVTQPTQTLHHVTQPTQPLPARDGSDVQVERSSPLAPTSSQRTTTQPIGRAPFSRPNGFLAGAMMAPPGTTFRRPPGVRPKPIVHEVDSDDDPPVVHSDEETPPVIGSNLQPTSFKKAGRGLDSSPNRVVQESPMGIGRGNNAFDNLMSNIASGAYTFQPKPADDMISAYGSVSRPPRPQPRQNGPAKAIPISSSPAEPEYRQLEDIPDFNLRKKVENMEKVLGESFSTYECWQALTAKRGNYQDALDYAVQLREDAEKADELALSESPIQRKGVARSTSYSSYPSQTAQPTAKQQVKASAQTISEKYARKPSIPNANSKARDSEDSDEDDIKPRRGRLVNGRKQARPSPPSSPPPEVQPQRRQPPQKRQVITIDSDSEEDSAIGREASAEPEPEPERSLGQSVQEMRNDRLLNIINTNTAHDLAELSGMPEDTIQYVLEKRPFDSLESVEAVTMETLTKTGKVSKKTRAVGQKLVTDCTEVMTGYDAIDELVVECERKAQPVQDALRGWGVGESAEGELQLMSLDEAHDSGIGTPASSCTADDHSPEKSKKRKSKFIGQPENMSSELVMKNYQLVGLNWLNLLFEKGMSCILADDMGLGKTCQVIAFLAYLQLKQNDGVNLIVVPGSTLENWLREFGRFAPKLNVKPYYGSQAERQELQYAIEQEWSEIDVIVTTYDMAVKPDDNKFFRRNGPFSVCVYDEAHQLRNPKSLRYSSLVRLTADFKVLLTGTPLQNNLQELVAILAFIMPSMFREKREDLEYIFKHKASTKDTASAALLSNERIARARTMMTPFILRRKKAQVLDLPKKTSRVEYCDMTDIQAEFYHDLREAAQQFYSDKAKGAAKGSAKQTSNVIMSLRKAAIHPLMSRRLYDDKKLDKIVTALSKSDEFGENPREKILAYLNGESNTGVKVDGGDFGLHKFCSARPFLAKKFALKRQEWMDAGKVKKFEELVIKFAANGDRVLVFSQFTTLMDILEAVLEQLNIKFMRLDGSTKMDIRQDMIDQFYDDSSITVFMLSTRAGGAGINLAVANKVIIFDSGFNPQDDVQAENRAHRVGQTREVEVVRLVTRGTIEEQIHALGESKLALDERVAGEGASAAETAQAEKAGEQLVEQMFVEELKKETVEEDKESLKTKASKEGGGDLKDAFKESLEGQGVKVASKQAQY